MIAYHYPPEGSSSGVQRTLKFSRHLVDHGWRPIVLTAHPRAYRISRSDQLGEVPSEAVVHRAFALDSARHLAVRRRYLGLTALPDPWVSWWLGAVASGVRLIRRYRPKVIWSTYPIATAHLIGLALQRWSRLPWVADFRDSMTEPHYPPDERQRRVYRWIEERTMRRSLRAVFTTPGAVRMYSGRYPEVPSRAFAVIPNGYDEESFAQAERLESRVRGGENATPLVLLHSGALYPSERDPRSFYRALARLLREGRVDRGSLRVVLRATGHDAYHQRLIREQGIEDIVFLEPPLPYHEALREMMDVDGLLLFQASNCNHQVPAKIYEYLRAKRPILALTDPVGDTAQVLRDARLDAIEPLDDERRIARGILRFLAEIRSGGARVAAEDDIEKHSRRAHTATLAGLFDGLTSEARTR
jgi:glycosyltransferase involved in cell wall biosynthesis